jgi:hypothetical protein
LLRSYCNTKVKKRIRLVEDQKLIKEFSKEKLVKEVKTLILHKNLCLAYMEVNTKT